MSSNDDSCINTLREQIEDSLVSSISEHRFLPIDKLHEILTLPVIKRAVKELKCGPDERIKLADTIYREGRRVFAMLIYDYKQDLIVEFRKHGALDSRLPLDEASAKTIVKHSIAHRIVQDLQWRFYPYTFPENMSESDHEIQRKMILPFLGSERIDSGAFGDVDKMTISPSQQNFDKEAKLVQVVRKRLKSKDNTEKFKREVSCLRLLSRLQHPNIIPLWGSYTYRDEQNFLFPFVDTNLGSFLKAETPYQDFQWDFTFYSALTGLASALSKTHHLSLNEDDHDINFEAIGYHHDIRPPNVLVGPDTFILADFGLGRLRQEDLSHTPHKWTSGDYVAPESTDQQENPLTANRATDVWAFGCLIAEVITYMLAGAKGVKAFQMKRFTPGRLTGWKDASFYQPHGDVKQEVIDWMGELKRDNPHPDFVPRLVDLVLDVLQRDPQKRPDMNTIHQRLKILSMKKYFHAVRAIFRDIHRAGEEPEEPIIRRHLESLRYAQERFDVWGSALGLGENGVSEYVEKQSEILEILKKLHRALREEPQRRYLGSRHALSSLEHLIVQSVEDLWKLLPSGLDQSAEDQWQEKILGSGLVQQMPGSHHAADSDLPAAITTDPLKSEFEEEARRFKESLDDGVPLNDILKITSIDDLYDITDRIQAESGGLRNLSKIQTFLERIKGYTSVINIIIDGSHNVLGLLWGSIAILLQLARPLNEAYDSLIDAVSKIGQTLPNFQVSVSMFNQDLQTKEILILFLKDLLNFYGTTLKFFSHPNWMHIFNRLWPKQYAYCLEVADHIERLHRLMRTEIRIEDIHQEYEFRKKALENFKAQSRETRSQEFRRIVTSFSPCRYDTTLYRLRGLRYHRTGDWLFTDKTFTQWLNSSLEETRVLWLKGIPGAGKTVLSSRVLDYLKGIRGIKTAFVFLTYQEAKTSALSTIHSLVLQMAEGEENLMAMVCESVDEDLRSDLGAAGSLLSSLIKYSGVVYLVIDGVDEVSETERGRLVRELLRLVEECETLRIVLSTRAEADLVRLLGGSSVTIQIHDHNEGSIKNYVLERAKHIFNSPGIPPKTKVKIENLLTPLASRAKGMFLYARLIMDMVAMIHDLSELQKELTVLPENLEAAYHRIIVRLGGHKEADKARRLLGWLACSPAPITVEEAHQALVVMPGNRDQDFDMLRKLNVVELLGPIVETVDTYIRFVHFTAKEYISSPHLGAQLINPTQAILDLAVRSINYLCQRHHDPDLSLEERCEKVTTGQYSFHAFATRMWFELVCQYLQSTKMADPSVELIESINMLWEYRKTQELHDSEGHESEIESEIEGEVESDSATIFAMLEGKQPLLYQTLYRVSRFRNSSFLFTGKINTDSNKDMNDPFSISDTSRCIRKAFDAVLCNSPIGRRVSDGPGCHENRASILLYYGPRPFKCKFPGCEFWRHGFQDGALRDRHENSHDRPLKCHVAGCQFELIGFLSERMRRKHFEQAHRSNPIQPSFNAEDLPQGDLKVILSDLIQVNQVKAVQEILFAFPDVLESDEVRNELRLLAAPATSSDMLKLLERPAEFDEVKPLNQMEDYISESIRGRNESTLSYFLSRAAPFPIKSIYTHMGVQRGLVPKLVSSDWLEGMKIYCEWIRSGLRRIHQVNISEAKELFGYKHNISAASHSTGEQQLLYLWKNSGVVQSFGKAWVTHTLRSVTESSSSVTIAAYLLKEGADINYRPRRTATTALQRAARRKSSAEAAEMIKFLLLNGADPEADQEETKPGRQNENSHRRARPRTGRKIRDEVGAKDIHRWLGKTWDELVEETRCIRNNKDVGKVLMSRVGEDK